MIVSESPVALFTSCHATSYTPSLPWIFKSKSISSTIWEYYNFGASVRIKNSKFFTFIREGCDCCLTLFILCQFFCFHGIIEKRLKNGLQNVQFFKLFKQSEKIDVLKLLTPSQLLASIPRLPRLDLLELLNLRIACILQVYQIFSLFILYLMTCYLLNINSLRIATYRQALYYIVKPLGLRPYV